MTSCERSGLVRVLLFVAGCWRLAPGCCPAQDWKQFGGPNGNFRLTIPTAASATAAEVLPWSQPLQAGDAAPIVVGDRVVISEAAFTEDGLDAHALNCIQLTTGKPLWKKILPEQNYVSQDISDRYPVRPVASCVASGDKVFALGFGGSLRCLSLSEGNVLWQKDLVADFGATPLQFGFATSPWCDEKQVIVACGGEQALILSLSQESGEPLWRLAAGELGYGGFCKLMPQTDAVTGAEQPTEQLAYMGRDQVIAFETKTGRELWSFALPKSGLTNAVTPLALPNNRLLVGGQGTEGCILLSYQDASTTSPPTPIWHNRKVNPFYCNWLTNPAGTQVMGSGQFLAALELEQGQLLWTKRGWTDANLAWSGEELVAVRGDGVAATADWTADGISLKAARRVTQDRVWAPPVLVGSRLLIRGRNSLSCVDWQSFPAATKLPQGTEIDAMTAMYGTLHEAVEKLRTQATNAPETLTFADFERVAEDRSVFLGEGDFTVIIEALEKAGKRPLAEQIATAWIKREPFSLPALEAMVRCLINSGNADEATRLSRERSVEVTFLVTVPETTPQDAVVYVNGNTAALGSWKPDGLRLERQASGIYKGTAVLPQGDLQFKCTLGSWEQEEKRADGRSISNRRRRLSGTCQIEVNVSAWATAVK